KWNGPQEKYIHETRRRSTHLRITLAYRLQREESTEQGKRVDSRVGRKEQSSRDERFSTAAHRNAGCTSCTHTAERIPSCHRNGPARRQQDRSVWATCPREDHGSPSEGWRSGRSWADARDFRQYRSWRTYHARAVRAR